MSDTSLSDAIPADAELEQGLRDAVRNAFKRGDNDSITVKRIRATVESKLGLDEGFFKEESAWKEKSKNIIQSEVVVHKDDEPPSSNLVPEERADAKDKSKITEQAGRGSESKKRKSNEPPQSKPRKKRKSASDNEDEGGADDPVQEAALISIQASTSRSKKSEVTARKSTKAEENATDADSANGSESEMSVVLDEEPKPKRRKRSSSGSKPKAKKAEATKSRKPGEASADPDADEIKRLQGWLIKCGIRKMWYKELAPYDTPKLKIKHLKDMLTDAGMTGRYSKEKADEIRDQRELKADLEAVQEGEKTWGKSNSEDEKSDSEKKPRRRLARGLQGLDFLGSDDGEETD